MKCTKNNMLNIYLADLSYLNKYSAPMITVPLNMGYIASYVKQYFNRDCNIIIFKDPKKLLESAKENPPDILGLSCFYWNINLNILVANKVKKINQECIVVAGGPNIDTDPSEQFDLYKSFNGAMDILVPNEGELGFLNIVERRLSNNLSDFYQKPLDGCVFYHENVEPVFGRDIGLSIDLDTLSSPIITGLMDEFLNIEYMPMIQTSRMCPYSCAFCCSGKLPGKIRKFPLNTVNEEIRYISKKYRKYPHKLFFITDENFGINKRDSIIARYLIESNETIGYPQQTFCYFDKRLSRVVKDSAILFADMNYGGLQLAFQSFNDDALKAVKRSNMTKKEIKQAVMWANKNALKTSTEMIFGLPYETKQSFLNSMEYLMKQKIDSIAAHNLFLFKGIELNRKKERDHYNLKTKFRPTFVPSYDMIDNVFVCESEEVVTSSSHFSFEDYLDIRKISLLFYTINAIGYFKKVINFLIDCKINIISMLDQIMNPLSDTLDIEGYKKYVDNFLNDAKTEMSDTIEDVQRKLKLEYINNQNRVAPSTRLNIEYSARLIYQEKWFGKVITRLTDKMKLDIQQRKTLRDLIKISENEWLNLHVPEQEKNVIIDSETIRHLNINSPQISLSKYQLNMSSSASQIDKIRTFNQQYLPNNESYYFFALDMIQPRKYLRFEDAKIQPC